MMGNRLHEEQNRSRRDEGDRLKVGQNLRMNMMTDYTKSRILRREMKERTRSCTYRVRIVNCTCMYECFCVANFLRYRR